MSIELQDIREHDCGKDVSWDEQARARAINPKTGKNDWRGPVDLDGNAHLCDAWKKNKGTYGSRFTSKKSYGSRYTGTQNQSYLDAQADRSKEIQAAHQENMAASKQHVDALERVAASNVELAGAFTDLAQAIREQTVAIKDRNA